MRPLYEQGLSADVTPWSFKWVSLKELLQWAGLPFYTNAHRNTKYQSLALLSIPICWSTRDLHVRFSTWTKLLFTCTHSPWPCIMWAWSATHQPNHRRQLSTLKESWLTACIYERKQSVHKSSWNRKEISSDARQCDLYDMRWDRSTLPCKCLINERQWRIYSPNRQDRYSVRLLSWKVRQINC